MTSFRAELWFLWRDRAAVFWLAIALVVTLLAVVAGIHEVRSQRKAIRRLVVADAVDRQAVTRKQRDWGSAAYYTFHLTYDEPSSLAFAALGQRDVIPWKHRIRMLALEGQIYESDVDNPAFALSGRIDFAFVASMLVPLFVIFLLHALRSGERSAGRFELLVATAAHGSRPWSTRAALRMAALSLCILGPLAVGGLWENSRSTTLGAAGLAVLLHIGFWWWVVDAVSRRASSSAVGVAVLVGLWLGLAALSPAVIKTVVDRVVPIPEGARILLTQREAVNDAWDLPKAATMAPFVERHPKWRDHAEVERPFEWKWYFAFQQVGDQTVETLSEVHRSGRLSRDRLVGWLSLLSPPVWLERTLQALAETDVEAALAYEQSVRDFHAELRAFYYPSLFEKRPFDPSAVALRPEFGRGRVHRDADRPLARE